MKKIEPNNSSKCCTLTFIRCKIIPPIMVADGSSDKSTDPKTLHENESEQSYKIYHVQRTNNQAGIRQKFLTNSPAHPDPQSCGWLIENHVPHVMWMSGLPTPEAVLKFTACKCGNECTMSSC